MANKPGINNLFNIFEGMNAFGAGPGARTRSLLDTIDPVTGKPLITQDAIEKANRQSIGTGIVTGLASYLAQPKNKGYGSAVPYLAQSYLQANKAAQAPFQGVADKYAMDTQLAEQQRVLGQRSKTKEVLEQMILKDPDLAYLRNAPDAQILTAINEKTKANFAVAKPISMSDQMDQIIFDVNAKKERGEPLTLTDKANLKAARQVKLMGSSDPSGLKSAMLPGAEKGREGQAKDFGKIANEWIIGNKSADANMLIQNLEEVSTLLKSSDNITGGMIGALPMALRERIYPESIAAQERVESVVQRGLRETLGAQFTENEGVRLIKRAYNPNLPEEENLKRVNRLLATMKIAYQRKNDAVAHYQKFGTMDGYDYIPITPQDFYDVLPQTSIDTVKNKNYEELTKEFPKPAGMDDETYQSILNNL